MKQITIDNSGKANLASDNACINMAIATDINWKVFVYGYNTSQIYAFADNCNITDYVIYYNNIWYIIW